MALKKILEIGHHFGKVIVKTVAPIFGNGANRPTRHKHSIQTNDEVCDLSTTSDVFVSHPEPLTIASLL